MTIAHHPDPATLITCSAGSQPEALCAVVASHISICPVCSAEFRRMDMIGAVLFADLEPQSVAVADGPPVPATPPPDTGEAPAEAGAPGEIPPTLAGVIGTDLDSLSWEGLWPGVVQHRLALSAEARGDLRLLRLAPGAALAEHGHRGEELTLVLRGACRDGGTVLRAGDFADLDDETRHAPVATEDGECILLVASERTPEFVRPAESSAA